MTPLDCSPANLRKHRDAARAVGGYSVAMQEIDARICAALGHDGLDAFDEATGEAYLSEPSIGYEATEEEYAAALLAWARHRAAQHHALIRFSEGVGEDQCTT